VLTKPLGSGILTTAFKAGMAGEELLTGAVRWMVMLNDLPRRLPEDILTAIRAATDVTGFGFLGHCLDMVSSSDMDVEILSSKIPSMEGALEMAAMGMVPAGAYSNRDHFSSRVKMGEHVKLEIQDLLYDPQTSGGLLLAVDPPREGELIKTLREIGFTESELVGRFKEGAGSARVI
jgi:selenide,water dikinase